MGAQLYQEQIAARAAAALDPDGGSWTVKRLIARSMRAPLDGDLRLPIAKLSQLSARGRSAVGALIYGRRGIVHRMNLELPPAPAGRDVVTLHDVVAWRFEDESAPVAAAAAELRRAAAVICVSEFTAAEATELLGITNPHVIHNGVEARFFDAAPLDGRARSELGLPERFVLHAGGASRRKNVEALADAWPIVHRAHPELTLVLSGPAHPRRSALFAGLDGVRLVGRLPDAVMPAVVASAGAVVVPSTYEGFGLPALEAMATRTPLVAAAASSLPEIVGDGGLLVAPNGPAIADGIIAAVAGDADVAARVEAGYARARRFTWERSAREHAEVWRAVAAAAG